MKGDYNHYIVEGEKFIGEGRIKGYALYSLGSYPAINRDKNSSVPLSSEGKYCTIVRGNGGDGSCNSPIHM